jgi:hypothetical protein
MHLRKFDEAPTVDEYLARLARIPADYFNQIDPALRAANFNARFPQFHRSREAMAISSYVGSHDEDVLPRYRYRLRLGAGQLTRGGADVCKECRRLIIGLETGLN